VTSTEQAEEEIKIEKPALQASVGALHEQLESIKYEMD